jgi:post-segregation antitoxin (ccd killing protein)
MSVRLYMDEDSMDQALVRALRARGVDVKTALEEGMRDIIERPMEENRA